MADFCKQCSIDFFGEDCKDLANLGECNKDEGFSVICEGCGLILVDKDGNCIMCELYPNEPGHGPARFVRTYE